MPNRRGDGARWPDAPEKRRWARTVTVAVEAARAEVVGLGVPARVSVHWSSAHDALIVRCLVLRAGLPDADEREQAAFAGGYLAAKLAGFRPRLQFHGHGQNLVISYAETPLE